MLAIRWYMLGMARRKPINGPRALQDALRARGLSRAQAAQLTGLSTPMIAFLARGKRVPGLGTARLLHSVLGVPLESEWPPEVER